MRPRIFLLSAVIALMGIEASAAAPTAATKDSSRASQLDSVAARDHAAVKDSLAATVAATNATDSLDTVPAKTLYEYISYPILQMITLPIEVVLVPVVKLALYPSKPPLRYMLNENVIDRTIRLISFGDNDKIMLYPTMNLAPGTGSSTGLTLRDQSLFGRSTERAVAQGVLYVNGDWKFRTYFTAADILSTGLNTKLAMNMNRVKNTSANQPGTPASWYYADTSNTYSASLSHLLIEKVALKGTFVYRDNHFGVPPVQQFALRSDFFKNDAGVLDAGMRGLSSNLPGPDSGKVNAWADRIFAVGIGRDTRNNQNIVLAGSEFGATYHYHLTTKDHDFHGWETELTNYFKLGKEKYEISGDEERKSGPMSMKKVLKKMEIDNLKKELFNRKVFVTHLYSAQVYELPGNHMPVYGLQTLGNDTPMRGYSGSRFRDYTVLSAGAEYRFPIMRLVDGVMFDEYGFYGRSWDKIDYLENLKNSWGFGIRVRRPDIYLFRLQLGFHGLHGIQLNMSVDEPY